MNLGYRDGGIPPGLSFEYDLSLLLFMSLGVVILILCLMLSLSSMPIILSVVLSVRVLFLNLLDSLPSMSGQLIRMCRLVNVFFSAPLGRFGRP